MPQYICEKCNKEFKQKSDFDRHMSKKYPCITQEQLKSVQETIQSDLIEVKNSLTEDESLKILDSFFNRMRDLLRDNENITGDKALDVITDFLLLRLINYEMDTNENINFISKQYNDKIKIDKIELNIDDYKKYFKWSELVKLVNEIDKDSKAQTKKELLTNVVQHVIFNGIFKYNEHTKDIYRNRRFYVQKLTTITKLIKEFNKIDFDKYDVDVKGRAYELTLMKEGATNKDFSQFFTPRWIDKYMVSNADIEIQDDGSYTKIMDPACGTAGILSEYLSTVRKSAEKKDIILDNNVSNYIYGYEIVDDTLKIAHMNVLLKSGSYNDNLNCKDFLEIGCTEYINEKFDGNIIMNPPFALTKNYNLEDDNELKQVFHTKTKSGTMLFLMSALNSIADGRQLIMVSPNGKEIFNKNKEFVNIRKHTMNTANVYKIAMLPSQSFKPYTGVETLILMIRKGTKTKEIQFVQLEKDKNDNIKETELCKVKYSQLEKNNFSWNYKEYCSNQGIKYSNIEYKKLGDICEFMQKSKRQASYGKDIGKYKFYTSSTNIKYCDDFDYNNECIIIGDGGNANIYIDTHFSCSDHNHIIKSNNETMNNKYMYYYLLVNIDILNNGFKGTTIKNLSKDYLTNLQIPIPPLEVQNIIVKELDSFYKQKESLMNINNEMNTFRKAKFEMLLLACENKQTVKLGDVSELISGSFSAEQKQEIGKYPLYTGTINNPVGYLDEYCFDKEEYIILIRGGGCPECRDRDDNTHVGLGTVFYVKGKSAGIGGLCSLYFTDNVNVKYMYQYLKTKQNEFIKKANFTTRLGNINISAIKDFTLQLPLLEDQQKIIEQMESYDKLVELQQKQINDIDKLVKERFDYHLNKCKSTDDNNTENLINESEKESINDESINDESIDEVQPTKLTKKFKVKKVINEPENKLTNESIDDVQQTKLTKKIKAKKVINEPENESIEEVKPTKIIKVKKISKKVLTDE
jgi:type I restriction enzyme S subunit